MEITKEYLLKKSAAYRQVADQHALVAAANNGAAEAIMGMLADLALVPEPEPAVEEK